MTKRKSSPDDLLAVQNYPALNETFYSAKPHDYFGQRLQNLMLVAGNAEGLDRLLEAGLSFRGLNVAGGPPQGVSDEDTAKKRDEAAKAAERFVTAEAEVLSQHVGETLLRLYLAHEFPAPRQAPPCPWLELSRVRTPGDFKKQVARRFGEESDPQDPIHLAAVARVFHLVEEPASLTPTPPPADQWSRSLTNIEGYLRHFASQFLRRAALYNAAKHGLAVLPTEISMKLGEGEVIKADGPVIRYLEVRERAGQPRWGEVHHWVKPDLQMGLVFRACQLIETLWEVARLRYLPALRPETFQVRLFAGASVDDLIRSDLGPDGSGIVVEEMVFELLYYEAPREEGAVAQSAVADAENG